MAETTTKDSYADVFREVTTSAKQLIQSEVELIKVEARDLTTQATNKLTQAIVFGALLIVSAVPLLAAAVLALGQYWDMDYALSALIVGLVCMATAGAFFYRAMHQLGDVGTLMPATQGSLREGVEVVKQKSTRLTTTMTGV